MKLAFFSGNIRLPKSKIGSLIVDFYFTSRPSSKNDFNRCYIIIQLMTINAMIGGVYLRTKY